MFNCAQGISGAAGTCCIFNYKRKTVPNLIWHVALGQFQIKNYCICSWSDFSGGKQATLGWKGHSLCFTCSTMYFRNQIMKYKVAVRACSSLNLIHYQYTATAAGLRAVWTGGSQILMQMQMGRTAAAFLASYIAALPRLELANDMMREPNVDKTWDEIFERRVWLASW